MAAAATATGSRPSRPAGSLISAWVERASRITVRINSTRSGTSKPVAGEDTHAPRGRIDQPTRSSRSTTTTPVPRASTTAADRAGTGDRRRLRRRGQRRPATRREEIAERELRHQARRRPHKSPGPAHSDGKRELAPGRAVDQRRTAGATDFGAPRRVEFTRRTTLVHAGTTRIRPRQLGSRARNPRGIDIRCAISTTTSWTRSATTLEAMTQLVRIAMERATSALLDGDLAGAERVISDDPAHRRAARRAQRPHLPDHRPAAAGGHRSARADHVDCTW